jgi:hypothetical protein
MKSSSKRTVRKVASLLAIATAAGVVLGRAEPGYEVATDERARRSNVSRGQFSFCRHGGGNESRTKPELQSRYT